MTRMQNTDRETREEVFKLEGTVIDDVWSGWAELLSLQTQVKHALRAAEDVKDCWDEVQRTVVSDPNMVYELKGGVLTNALHFNKRLQAVKEAAAELVQVDTQEVEAGSNVN